MAQEEDNKPPLAPTVGTTTLSGVVDFDREKEVTCKDLEVFTDNFDETNKIGRTHFGILYRAKIPQGWRGLDQDKYVTVKMWDTKSYFPNGKYREISPEYLLERVKDEIRFLSLPFLEGNQNVVKVEGYCFEENKLGVIYAVKSLDTIHNIMDDKEKFGWRERVKVALGLSRFLQLCHFSTPKYIVRNLSAAHIVVDEDYNPYVVDFAMILGGDIGDGSSPEAGVPLFAYGYSDDHVVLCGRWGTFTDVYTFGVILLELMVKYTSCGFKKARKIKFNGFIDDIVHMYYENQLEETKNEELKCCFVNQYLRRDQDFDVDDGTELSMLALRCISLFPGQRPKMEKIVRELENVVDKFGVC